MKIPKTVTAAKASANKRNAANSTGPKSPRGKFFASQSAITHGLFAREMLLPGESESEFIQLQSDVSSSYCPVGFREIRRVKRLIWLEWRLRRFHRAETGELAKHLADHNPKTMAASSHTRQYMQAVTTLQKLEQIKEQISSERLVSKDNISWLRTLPYEAPVKYFLDAVELGQLAQPGEEAPPRPGMPAPPESRQSTPTNAATSEAELNFGRDTLLYFLDLLKQAIKREQVLHGQDMIRRAEGERNALLVPEDAVLDRMIRYENHIVRKIECDECALERMQRLRRGEEVPPPSARID